MTANAIIINARLQSAAENTWRNNPSLHVPETWERCDHRKMALPEFYPSVTFSAEPDATTAELPYLLLRPEPMLTAVRVIVTAPLISSEWFWIACRFHWRNGIEYNYTN